MTAPKIRADYEGLQKITQSFSTESGHITATTSSVKTIVDTLRAGDWVGPGATAFYQEMDSAVFPGLNRLSAGLGDAAQAAARINGLNGIEVSAVNGKVVYSADTDGEGLTLQAGTVTIGDDAFTTPGWLASSIGHEALHAEQIRDGRFNDTPQGVAMNEVEAYDWEIRNADRFGLSGAEKATISQRRDKKYGRLDIINKARADAGIYTIP